MREILGLFPGIFHVHLPKKSGMQANSLKRIEKLNIYPNTQKYCFCEKKSDLCNNSVDIKKNIML